MSELTKLDRRHIKVLSISEEVSPAGPGQPADWAKVVFQIGRGGPEFPVFVDRTTFSDENLIQVARHYLHVQAHRLAEFIASWRLSDEEYQRLASPPKTAPNRGPVIPG